MLLKSVLASLAALAALVAAVNAAPVSQSEAVSANEATPTVIFLTNHNSTDSTRNCDSASFYDMTSETSPQIDDCNQIATNIAGGGSWEIETVLAHHHQLVQYGTCAFGVQCSSIDLTVHIGNQDIIDLIYDSVNKFGRDGRVGARGYTLCDSVLKADWVFWDIYHT